MCFKILLVLLNSVGCSRKWPLNCPSAVGAATAGPCCLSLDPSADIVGLPESASVSSHAAQQQHHTRARTALASQRRYMSYVCCVTATVDLQGLGLSPDQTQRGVGSNPTSSETPELYRLSSDLLVRSKTSTDS